MKKTKKIFKINFIHIFNKNQQNKHGNNKLHSRNWQYQTAKIKQNKKPKIINKINDEEEGNRRRRWRRKTGKEQVRRRCARTDGWTASMPVFNERLLPEWLITQADKLSHYNHIWPQLHWFIVAHTPVCECAWCHRHGWNPGVSLLSCVCVRVCVCVLVIYYDSVFLPVAVHELREEMRSYDWPSRHCVSLSFGKAPDLCYCVYSTTVN